MQYFVIAALCFVATHATQWPVPYERVTSRPPNNPYCQAGLITFCPNGKATDAMIYAQDETDTIEVFALKKPVWSFKFGDLMAKLVSSIVIDVRFVILAFASGMQLESDAWCSGLPESKDRPELDDGMVSGRIRPATKDAFSVAKGMSWINYSIVRFLTFIQIIRSPGVIKVSSHGL